MKNKKKIIFIEPHMDGPRGHHMDSLIAKSISLQKYGKIYWIVSNKFKQRQAGIPKYVKIINILDTAKRKISFFEIGNTLNTFFLILKNFFLSMLIIFQLLKSREYAWIYPFFYNFFSFPKYLPSFFSSFENLQTNQNDQIIFNSCSDLNDYELAFFLYFYKKNRPTFHMFIRTLPKFQTNRIKTPFYFLKKFKKINELNKKFYLYAETKLIKDFFFKICKIKVSLFHDFYFFSSKPKKTKIINIGFFGEAREDKGFSKYLPLIEKSLELDRNLNFIIQFSKVPKELRDIKKNLSQYVYKNKKIRIIPKYLNYLKYRKLLTKVHIVPILHDVERISRIGSGVIFSCIANQIPMVIPKSSFIKQNFNFKYNSYLEASSLEEYAKKILYIYENYNYFLNESKKEAKHFQEKFNSYPFLDRIKKKK